MYRKERMNEEELLKKRMMELAQKSYHQSIYTHTSFLSLAEQAIYYEVEREVEYAKGAFLGGYPYAERKILMFGSEELLGYPAPDPVVCLKIQPIAPKYSEKLSHRDYLGAVLNLGMERECIGDILVDETGAYLFCMEHMAEFLRKEISKIRHTLVTIKPVEKMNLDIRPQLKPVEGFVNSFRLDAIVSLGFSLSRKESAVLIQGKKVFINGRLAETNGKAVIEGDIISVRGMGKMIFSKIRGQSKKGRHSVLLHRFV